MLIRVIENVKSVEFVIPSLIRFDNVADNLYGPNVSAVYRSFICGDLQGARALHDREVEIADFVATRHKAAGEMIEGGTKIVQNVADNSREIIRDLLSDANHKSAVVGRPWIDVLFKGNALRLSLLELLNFRVKLVNVFVGPI
jgi:hypothetical protein